MRGKYLRVPVPYLCFVAQNRTTYIRVKRTIEPLMRKEYALPFSHGREALFYSGILLRTIFYVRAFIMMRRVRKEVISLYGYVRLVKIGKG